jgi:hypothetical protein
MLPQPPDCDWPRRVKGREQDLTRIEFLRKQREKEQQDEWFC